MQNQNLTREMAKFAVAVAYATIQGMHQQKIIPSIDSYIVIVHPSTKVIDGKFEVLYEDQIGWSSAKDRDYNAAMATDNALAAMAFRNLLREDPNKKIPSNEDGFVGCAFRHDIAVGVSGLLHPWDAVIAGNICDTCHAFCVIDRELKLVY